MKKCLSLWKNIYNNSKIVKFWLLHMWFGFLTFSVELMWTLVWLKSSEMHKGPLAHNVSFWIQKLIHNVSFWIQNRNWHYLSVSGSINWHIISVSGSWIWSIISVSGSRNFLTRNWHSTSVYGSRNWCYGSVSGSRNWSITSVSGCLAIFLLLSFFDYNGLSFIVCQAQP